MELKKGARSVAAERTPEASKPRPPPEKEGLA
jgi:hypothetical protein